MDRDINIVFDLSGSMAELGKIRILKSLAARLMPLVSRHGEVVNFWGWREAVTPLKGPRDMVLAANNSQGLIDFIEDNGFGGKYLLLSDGLWAAEITNQIKQQVTATRSCLVAVAIGADANTWSLSQISHGQTMYSSADIVTAVQSLCCADMEVSS